MSLLPIAGGNLDVSGTGSAADVNGYVCNMSTGAHGEYTNFAFNSLANIGGVIYGCLPTRVHSLTGTTDNGTAIGASCLTGFISTAPETQDRMKNIDLAWINARLHTTPIKFRTRNDEATDRLYPAYPSTAANAGMSPIKIRDIAKGLRGRNWQIGIENVSGNDFEVSDIDVKLNILQRRI